MHSLSHLYEFSLLFVQHHEDPAIGVHVIDRYTYYVLQFLEGITPHSKNTIGELVSGSSSAECYCFSDAYMESHTAPPCTEVAHYLKGHCGCVFKDAWRSLLTENNDNNSAMAMGLCAVFVVSWYA